MTTQQGRWRRGLLLALLGAAAPVAPAPAPATQPFALEVPRVTRAELLANATLMSGHWPYVLVGEATGWPALRRWTPESLVSRIPDEWVDYYPNNMLDVGNKPYLHRYSGALPLFQQDSPSPRYMQMRLSLGGWEELKKDLKALPKSFYTEAEWMPQCMATKTGGTELDRAAADNFYRVNQWNFLLIGEEGTGIFFHNDHLSAASWQAQIVGRKRWILCPYEQRRLFSSQMNPFDPDYGAHPDFARGYCADVTVEPGEIVYYPAYWWHATRNLDTPTMGITGLMVGNEDDRPDLPHPRVHEQFVADITHKCSKCWDLSKGPGQRRKCDDISERWPGAAPPISYDFCKTYLPRCQALWEDKEARDAQLRAAAEGGLMPIPEFDDILRRFVVPVTDLHVNAKVHDAEDLQKLQKAANAEVTTAARLVSEWGGDPAALPKDGDMSDKGTLGTYYVKIMAQTLQRGLDYAPGELQRYLSMTSGDRATKLRPEKLEQFKQRVAVLQHYVGILEGADSAPAPPAASEHTPPEPEASQDAPPASPKPKRRRKRRPAVDPELKRKQRRKERQQAGGEL